MIKTQAQSKTKTKGIAKKWVREKDDNFLRMGYYHSPSIVSENCKSKNDIRVTLFLKPFTWCHSIKEHLTIFI